MMKRILATLALMLGTASGAHAATITNGSFETGTAPGSYTTLGNGSTAITGWTVSSGNIDYIGSYWVASEGSRSLDLTGGTPGSISTTITDMIVGAVYNLYFDLSGNPDGQPANKILNVALSNPATQESYNYNYVSEGNSVTNMRWVTYILTFVATSTQSLLTFGAGNGGGGNACCYGPALDNVRIVQAAVVPLPAGGLLLLSGLAGFVALRRRKTA